MAECVGTQCEYYRQYAVVQKTGTDSYMPVFGLPPEIKCTHPNVFKPKGISVTNTGIDVNILKVCPKI